VVGGAQSAAEMLWTAHQTFPLARCTMVMRSIGLNAYETSKFTNELFYPSFVDEFYAAQPHARAQLLREMHRTNYAGLTPDMLNTLYRQIYLERLTGNQRLETIPMVDVVAADQDDREVVLTLVDRKSGVRSELRCDVVLLGTGFAKEMPAIVRNLATAAGLDEIAVNRGYRLNLPSSFTGTCHLQGVNEATHGIADSLLSVLAARAEDIVTDLLACRREASQLASTAPARPLAESTRGSQ
jgi:L-ornithine N5-oxygenase